jgi:hypothetical protein
VLPWTQHCTACYKWHSNVSCSDRTANLGAHFIATQVHNIWPYFVVVQLAALMVLLQQTGHAPRLPFFTNILCKHSMF